jgi:hypothetical protein
MTGFIEDGLLRSEGLDDADIATINAELADVRKVDALLIANWPLFSRLFTKLAPIFDKVVAKQQELK